MKTTGVVLFLVMAVGCSASPTSPDLGGGDNTSSYVKQTSVQASAASQTELTSPTELAYGHNIFVKGEYFNASPEAGIKIESCVSRDGVDRLNCRGKGAAQSGPNKFGGNVGLGCEYMTKAIPKIVRTSFIIHRLITADGTEIAVQKVDFVINYIDEPKCIG